MKARKRFKGKQTRAERERRLIEKSQRMSRRNWPTQAIMNYILYGKV